MFGNWNLFPMLLFWRYNGCFFLVNEYFPDMYHIDPLFLPLHRFWIVQIFDASGHLQINVIISCDSEYAFNRNQCDITKTYSFFVAVCSGCLLSKADM